MADETATNPVDGADTSELDTGTETQEVELETTEEPQFDDDGNEIIPVVEDEEIELDGGLKIKVPKDAAEAAKAHLLRQADYTRKTQEVAEARKALEAERATVYQASAAELTARAQIVAFDQQIANFGNVDWDAWEENDPFEAQKGWRQFQTLQQQRGQLAGQLSQHVQQRTIEQQRATAKRVDEGLAVLSRDIKGWSPQLAATLKDAGVKEYGFEQAEIDEDFGSDPRMVKVLHDAYQWRQSQGKQKQAKSHEAAQQARPAAKVGGASAPPAGLDDRLSAEEWTRRRNAQVRKRA